MCDSVYPLPRLKAPLRWIWRLVSSTSLGTGWLAPRAPGLGSSSIVFWGTTVFVQESACRIANVGLRLPQNITWSLMMPTAFLPNPPKGDGQKIQWLVQTNCKKTSSGVLLELAGGLPLEVSISQWCYERWWTTMLVLLQLAGTSVVWMDIPSVECFK